MRGGNYPDMPFNQQMSFPCELSLRTTTHGMRLCRTPIKEIESLEIGRETIDDHTLRAGEVLPLGKPGDLFDIKAEVAVSPNSSFGFRLHHQEITYANE